MTQPTIKSYFKIKSNPELSFMMSAPTRKRNLSLIHNTPTRSKLDESYEDIEVTIDPRDLGVYCHADLTTPKKCANQLKKCSPQCDGNISTCSDKTELYSLTPQTPKTPSSTPRKSFYSPSKKRKVKSPKKKLSFAFDSNSPVKTIEFKDDKTIFFHDMTRKFVSNRSLYSLIEEQSVSLLKKCLEQTEPCVKLICRLYWRKEGRYRYEEIKKIIKGKDASVDDLTVQDVINKLVQSQLIELSDSESVSFDDLVSVLRAPELKEICKDLKIKMKIIRDKEEDIKALKSFSQEKPISAYFSSSAVNLNSSRVLNMLNEKAGPTYMLPHKIRDAIYRVYVIMYLGINHSILTEKRLELILINDKIKKETYPIDKDMDLDDASIVFESKRDFDCYMEAIYLLDEFTIITDTNRKCEIIKQALSLYNEMHCSDELRYMALPSWLRRFTAAHLYVKIMSTGIQDLKRQTSYDLAIDILNKLIGQPTFRQHKKAEWYYEKALILHSYLKECDQAAQVLVECFKSDLPEDLKDLIRPKAIKIALQKNKKINEELKETLLKYANKESILEKNFKADHIQKAPMEKTSKGKSKFLTRTEEGLIEQDCEDYCISYYINHGEFTHGRHWEGSIIKTIFFLLFWDIIYTKPRGVIGIFMSYYQTGPLDLLTDCFYTNRKALIDNWLLKIQEMSTDELVRIIESRWSEIPETDISDMPRSAMSLSEVSAVCRALGGGGAAAACRRLAARYAYTRSGFPDLTLWNNINNKIKFVEVKTDSDKPSMKQKQWMRYLETHGIDTGFVYLGLHSTRNKARARDSIMSTTNNENDGFNAD